MMSDCKTPVLFLIFNRPALTRLVFERIREAKPSLLFVAADGPRAERPEEKSLCEESRRIAANVDWPCETYTLFRKENLGCGDAVSSAISWFFEHVEAGIILEDDCIPHPSFFKYCSELLDKYAEDTRIMTITGARFKNQETPKLASSYDFSIYHHIWGWATWRRAWNLYERKISRDHPVLNPEKLLEVLQDPEMVAFWSDIAAYYQSGKVDTWDYPWLFTCWKYGGLSIRPRENMISNEGHGPDATHTKSKNSLMSSIPLEGIIFPLKDPETVQRNHELDAESISIFLPKNPPPSDKMALANHCSVLESIRRFFRKQEG